MSLETLAAVLISGVIIGSLYALMASGLSLVWGTLRVFNFAHGTLIMLAAYVAWIVAQPSVLNAGAVVGIAAAAVVMAVAGVVLYLLTVRPFLSRPDAELVVIITTLSAATFLQNGALVIFGSRFKQVPSVAGGTVNVLGTNVTWHQVVIVILAPILLLGLAILLKRSKIGLAIRAVEQNHESALLAGVSPGFIYPLVFAASAALAAVAGVLLGAIQYITSDFGSDPLLKAFIVVIFGGLGSLTGTVVGAYAIGILEAVSIFVVGLYWTPVVLFVAIIAVMLVRPNGLLGRAAT
jgi:branched-chain amino acid transport system permease protein